MTPVGVILTLSKGGPEMTPVGLIQKKRNDFILGLRLQGGVQK